MCVLSCNPRLSRCVPEPQCRPGLNYSGWVSGPNNTRTARDTLQSGYWSAVQTSIPHVYLFLRYIRFGPQPTKNEVARALRSAMPIPGVVLSRRLLSPRACSLIRNRVLCLPARKNNVLALLALSLQCQRCVYRRKRGLWYRWWNVHAIAGTASVASWLCSRVPGRLWALSGHSRYTREVILPADEPVTSREAFPHCWLTGGPPSQTVARQGARIGSNSRA